MTNKKNHIKSAKVTPTNLAKRLGYVFKDESLFITALTHRSADKTQNYERLEFLGDAILSFIMAEHLYIGFAGQKEGKLTRMRATIVRQESLAQVAKNLGLGEFLILGTGEIKAGGRERVSILSDVVESLIGAIYLDSQDIALTTQLVKTWFAGIIQQADTALVLKDAKSQLQEWLQAKKLALPVYELKEIQGKAPNEVFVVICHVQTQIPEENVAMQNKTTLKSNVKQANKSGNTKLLVESKGKSRRIAEQIAADMMLKKLIT